MKKKRIRNRLVKNQNISSAVAQVSMAWQSRSAVNAQPMTWNTGFISTELIYCRLWVYDQIVAHVRGQFFAPKINSATNFRPKGNKSHDFPNLGMEGGVDWRKGFDSF